MKCLVTGATGFAGGHLARKLARQGHAVRALVRPGSSFQHLVEAGIEIFEGQIARRQDVIGAAAGVEQIYHVAAVYRTAGHPDHYYRNVNVGGTVNVLEAARAADCERVVHCSTVGVHGHVEQPPASETYRIKPGDIYQKTKLEAEVEVQEAISRGQPVTIVRPAAIYGEGDLRFLKLFRAIKKRRFVMIGPGTVRLHMVYIEDLVNGFMLCGSSPAALRETFIIAGPEAPTLNQLSAEVADAVGVPPSRMRIPITPVYVAGWLCETVCRPLGIDPPLHRRRVSFFDHHREFDVGKAKRLLHYEPSVSIAEGLRRTARWYSDQGLLPPNGDSTRS